MKHDLVRICTEVHPEQGTPMNHGLVFSKKKDNYTYRVTGR